MAPCALSQTPGNSPPADLTRLDLTSSGFIDPGDLKVFSQHWYEDETDFSLPADFDDSGRVDSVDLLRLLNGWGREAPTPTPTPTATPTSPPGLIPMTSIPPGSFLMGNTGSPQDSFYGYPNELPRHEVTIGYAFKMGYTEVTNEQFAVVLNWALEQGLLKNDAGDPYQGGDVHFFGRNLIDMTTEFTDLAFSEGRFTPIQRENHSMAHHPVKRVTWFGATAFCNWLSEIEGRTPAYSILSTHHSWNLVDRQGGGYRLPSESEWEYACRGPSSNPHRYSVFSFGDVNTSLFECLFEWTMDRNMVWCGNSGGWTQPVGRSANTFGLFEMHGNVAEWCEDHYRVSYSIVGSPTSSNYNGAPVDGSPMISGDPTRIVRGGYWNFHAAAARSSARGIEDGDRRYTGVGFRVVRVD